MLAGGPEILDEAAAATDEVDGPWLSLRFRMVDGAKAMERDLVAALERGLGGRYGLAFRPARELAIRQPGFDRYWNGSFDASLLVGER